MPHSLPTSNLVNTTSKFCTHDLIMQLADLTNPEIATLTRLLQLLPTENPSTYAHRITSNISDLPSRSPLKRASRLSSLLPSSYTSTNQLCKLHRPLSAPLITTLFHAFAVEVGPHLNTLTLHATSLTPSEQTRITALRELHSLWLPPDVYRSTFLAPPNTSQWPYLPQQCPACTLSRVAGHMPTLLSLRMILLSRTSTRTNHIHSHTRKSPRLTPYLTHWITYLSTSLNLSDIEFETLISTNDIGAAALKTTRKKLWRKRKESRRVWKESQLEQKQQRERGGAKAEGVAVVASGRGVGADPDTKAEVTQPKPSIRVSAASSNTAHHAPVEEDESSGSDSAENTLTSNLDAYAHLKSPAYLSSLSIASTISLHERPRTYIFPVTLTTHENVDIGECSGTQTQTRKRRQTLPIRPQPTNFGAVLSGQADDLNLEPLQATHPVKININALPSPSVYSRTSPIFNPLSANPASLDRDRDSYLPPVFPHHTAYLPPNTTSLAKRYQNLLSPNPLLRGCEKEVRMDSNPIPLINSEKRDSLPRRSSRRISPPTDSNWPAPVQPSSSASSSHFSQSPRRSQSTRSHPSGSSRISSITSMSANSAYSSSLKPAPLSVRSSRGSGESGEGEEQVVSTFTIKEGDVEMPERDWYAQRSDAGVGRSQTTREVSGSASAPHAKSEARDRARRRLEGGSGRSSAATDATRWSDVYIPSR